MSLDPYNDYVERVCNDAKAGNSTLEKLSGALGLSQLTEGVKSFLDNDIVNSLLNSPLRTLAEDVLSQAIHDNTRRISQNITNIVREKVEGKVANTLQDVRSLAFDSVITVMTFKNDMVMFFAAQIAEQAVKAIREKRANLIGMQEAVRKLHNALLLLAGGGPFFNKYLSDLRTALDKVNDAKKQIDMVHSSFFSTLIFPQQNFQSAKDLLDEAYNLMMPPVTGDAAEELKEGFLKNTFISPEYGDQLAMIMSIPKLTMEMLQQYDLYVVKVLKVNALLFAFSNCVQNIKAVTGGALKKRVLDLLEQEQVMLDDIINSMSLQLNGKIGAISGPVQVEVSTKTDAFGGTRTITKDYSPNPTKTVARAVPWSIRIKTARGMMELLDPAALQNISISNEALRQYNYAVAEIEKKDDRRTALAILHATDGKEQVADLEADFITFAFQANQAIVDSALTEQEQGRFSDKTVIALGSKLNSRLQLSIDQDREIEQILLRFIASTDSLLDSLRDTGNSLFRLLDDFGMDRASDALRNGLFGDFFAMNSKTATYVGAAMSGLALVQGLLSDESQKQCLQRAVNEIKAEETSKKLAASRDVLSNYAKQQKTNEKKCETRQKDKVRVEACSSQIDLALLKDNPLKSLSGIFNGIFGGSISDSLPFTSKFFPNVGATVLGAQDAVKSATEVAAKAKTEMASAINNVPGFDIDPSNMSLEDLTKAAEDAKGSATEAVSSAIEEAGNSVKVAEMVEKDALDTIKNATGVPDLFQEMTLPSLPSLPSIPGVI